jgi:hypothetical protein
VGIFALVLAVSALLLILAAEWPHLAGKIGAERAMRSRKRRRERFTVIEGESDDFAASVERDLANLPVIKEPDDRSRR